MTFHGIRMRTRHPDYDEAVKALSIDYGDMRNQGGALYGHIRSYQTAALLNRLLFLEDRVSELEELFDEDFQHAFTSWLLAGR